MAGDFGEFADGELAPLPLDAGGKTFDAKSLNECAGHWNTVQLRPAIQDSLNRRFDRELDAASRLQGGRDRTFALAGLGWAFNEMAERHQTEGRRAALGTAVNAIKTGAIGKAIAGKTTALQTAVELGMPSATRQLLAAGADPNPSYKGESMLLLHRAIKGGHSEILGQLLKAGARPDEVNFDDETDHPAVRLSRRLTWAVLWESAQGFVTAPALSFAAECRQADSVKLLLEYGADKYVMDNMRRTPLHTGAEHGDVAVVDALLQPKGDLEIQDIHGLTALNLAMRQVVIENGEEPAHKAVVVALLKRGANPDARDPMYGTALHLAAERGDFDLAEQLLEADADVDIKLYKKVPPGAGNGFTPLHLTVRNASNYVGLESMAKLLLEYGASVDAQDSRGATALHMAAKNNSVPCVDVLLEFNADTNLKDANGRTARQVAVELGHAGVVKALDAKVRGVAATTAPPPATRGMGGEPRQNAVSVNTANSAPEPPHKRPRVDMQQPTSPQPRIVTQPGLPRSK
jgi:ankyrin repeat protein